MYCHVRAWSAFSHILLSKKQCLLPLKSLYKTVVVWSFHGLRKTNPSTLKFGLFPPTTLTRELRIKAILSRLYLTNLASTIFAQKISYSPLRMIMKNMIPKTFAHSDIIFSSIVDEIFVFRNLFSYQYQLYHDQLLYTWDQHKAVQKKMPVCRSCINQYSILLTCWIQGPS